MSNPKHITHKGIHLERLDFNTAWYNEYMLVSYNTVVVYAGKRFIYVDYAQQSITTKKHIRAYLKKLSITRINSGLSNLLYIYLRDWRCMGRCKLLYDLKGERAYSVTKCPDLSLI